MSQQDQNDKSQYFYRASAADFMKIPGNPVVYWVTNQTRDIFVNEGQISTYIDAKQGLGTGDDAKFFRFFWEVDLRTLALGFKASKDVWSNEILKWVPLNKGGTFRKWAGNREYVIRFDKQSRDLLKTLGNKLPSEERYFLPFITWSDITSATNSFRLFDEGYLFSNTGHCAFPRTETDQWVFLAYCNNRFVDKMTKVLNPTIHFHVGYFNLLPYPSRLYDNQEEIIQLSKRLTDIANIDWDSYETSWGFSSFLLSELSGEQSDISSCYKALSVKWIELTQEAQRLEEKNNRIFIDAYCLQNELEQDVPLKEITLNCNPHYRYGSYLTDKELEGRIQNDTTAELISYSIGCMMGRYSIDKPGLILASQGETLQDYLNQIQNPRFMPDNDAILPLTDQEWFADDVTNRVREFVKVVWGEDTLQENLAFIAESLCLYAIKGKKGESSVETIRRYLSTQFYKDHIKTYKKRPIYWLFSSGKEKAFECLVYLHRYNESTLARMRTEYVTPLMGKYDAQQSLLQEQLNDASPAQQRELEKQLKDLAKKQTELRAFDENLKHYADMRIKLDLDDGVKVNYGKFGNLLADVKAITGDKE